MSLQIVHTHRAKLGEAATWDAQSQLFYWVDIEEKKLFCLDPRTKEWKMFSLPDRIGTLTPYDGKQIVVALQHEIALFDTEKEIFKTLSSLEAEKHDTRANDGKCDPAGRLWIGTMQLEVKTGGANLYCLDHQMRLKKKIANVTISNGIVWTADHQKMFYIDTPTKQITAYDYDIKTAKISQKKIAIKVPKNMGSPDGMTIDGEDMLWVAHYGAGMIARWNPFTGKLLRVIEVPAPNVSSCAFGDTDLRTLYITTAYQELSKEQLEKYPLSGSLFSIRTKVKGAELPSFKMKEKK